jgi:hypothetical protein
MSPGLSLRYLLTREGGTAGVALAAQLTECQNQTVLVLEARSEPQIFVVANTPFSSQAILGKKR